VAEALVLAERGGVDPALRDGFARAGVVHLLAISGFHVGIVAAALLWIAARAGVPVGRRGVVSVTGTAGYVALIGAPPAALRAALILGLVLGGRWMDRSVHRIGALGAALLLILLLDPLQVAGPGFQLSFLGSLGLVVYGGRTSAERPLPGFGSLRRWLGEGLRAGVAATLFTAPVVIAHFGRLSWVGVPTTLLVSPLVALAVPGALALLLVDAVAPGLALVVSVPLTLVLGLMVGTVTRVGDLPWAWGWLPAEMGPAVAALWLAVLALNPGLGRRDNRMIVPVLLATALLAWQALPGLQNLRDARTLELLVLDVGQGDGILVRTPAHRWLMVDAGPAGAGRDAGTRVMVPALMRRGVAGLEAAVVTHPDLDHLGGLSSVLRALPVHRVLAGGRAVGRAPFREALHTARELGVPWVAVGRGDSITVDGVHFRVLHPPPPEPASSRELPVPVAGRPHAGDLPDPSDPNDLSVVLLVQYGQFSALLTGDAPISVEEELVGLYPDLLRDLEVLKVGHHGSRTSTSRALLAASTPELAVVSSGRGNRFGHPHPGVLGRLSRSGVPVWRTDRRGGLRVRASSNGDFQAVPVR
jgi:competence protein ComEC